MPLPPVAGSAAMEASPPPTIPTAGQAAQRSEPALRRTSWLWSVGELVGGEEAPVHPYLVRQMSDVGFRLTLKVQTLGCA